MNFFKKLIIFKVYTYITLLKLWEFEPAYKEQVQIMKNQTGPEKDQTWQKPPEGSSSQDREFYILSLLSSACQGAVWSL